MKSLLLPPLVALASLLSGCGGHTYKCGTCSSNHCYGIVTWTGNCTGFSMELTAVPLKSGDCFVDDEGWLVDDSSSTSSSWVETGEENEVPDYGYSTLSTGTIYFWAYGSNVNLSSTLPSGVFHSYFLGSVARSDLDNRNWIAYKIDQDSKTPSTWHITISEAATGKVLYKEVCPDLSMTPTRVLEGQELAGSQNAEAQFAFFGKNAIIKGSKTTFRTADGKVTADHPPMADWFPSSKPSQTTDGGLFFTYCCLP